MRRWPSLVIVFAAIVTILAVPAAAAGNQPPKAAAGLDQSVTAGTTVFLDAGGSSDPDGQVTATEWSLRAPNGSTLTPSCHTCTAPTFTPNATGRWAVTVTVTDDDGATASDTLYVAVGESRGPTITMGAPKTTTPDTSTPIVVETATEERALRRVEVFHDGSRVDRFDVSGNSSSVTATQTFDALGSKELLAVATDEKGYVTTKTMTIQVVSNSAAGSGGTGGSTGTNSFGDDGNDCNVFRVGDDTHLNGNCERDRVLTMPDGERRLVDANRDGKLTMRVAHPDLKDGSGKAIIGEHVDTNEYSTGNQNDGIKEVDFTAVRGSVSDSFVQDHNREKKLEKTIQDISDSNIEDNEETFERSASTVGPSDSSDDSSDSGDSSDYNDPFNGNQHAEGTSPPSDTGGSSSSGAESSTDSDSTDSGMSGGHSGPLGPDSSLQSSSPPQSDDGLITDSEEAMSDDSSDSESSSGNGSSDSGTSGGNKEPIGPGAPGSHW